MDEHVPRADREVGGRALRRTKPSHDGYPHNPPPLNKVTCLQTVLPQKENKDAQISHVPNRSTAPGPGHLRPPSVPVLGRACLSPDRLSPRAVPPGDKILIFCDDVFALLAGAMMDGASEANRKLKLCNCTPTAISWWNSFGRNVSDRRGCERTRDSLQCELRP